MPSSVPSPAGKPSGEAHSLEHELLHGLPPVIARHTRLVLLGSFPGTASLAAGQYYAHPRNQFWLLLGTSIGIDLAALPYPERLQAISAAGIALWDAVAEGRRKGSLDSALSVAARTDLGALVARLPDLRLIACNGQTAARHAVLDACPERIVLPSSSAAHTLPLHLKQQAWNRIGEVLHSARHVASAAPAP